jgi:DNA-binding response OmpR family regulator
MNTTTILVVDDTQDLLDLYSVWLRQAGYKVLQASTGRECLRLVAEELPDLVLLDVMLPDMDGIEVFKIINSNDQAAAILVVHVSGRQTSADNAAEGLEAGADGYLTKPVEPRSLLAHVRALLRMKQTEEVLKRSEDQFSAAFDNALDAMLIADDQANYVDAKPAACALFDVPRAEILKRNLSGFLEPAQRRVTEKAWQMLMVLS